MWWRRSRPTAAELDQAVRDATGRLYDGDTVTPPGWAGWDAALSTRPVPGGHGGPR